MKNIREIHNKLNGDLSKWKPLPFWSWNDELEEERLINQIKWMKDNGIGGYFMHARSGLKTEYLSKKWMDCIKVCADYGYNNSLESWIYDENGWPSGFVGGKLLENKENRDKYITYKFGCFDINADVSYKLKDNNLIRAFENNGGEYLNLCIEAAVSTTDILNPDVTDKFINLTHEKYKKEFGEDFADKITGFFTDEPQYQRMHTAFTPILIDYYKEKYNESIFEKLGLLFVEAKGYRNFRYRYWTAMQHLMIENFAKRVQKWCTDNNVKFTGHYIEETTLFGQMMCCAGVMPFYVYMDMPGIDWLCSEADNEIPLRQIASVAAQFSKKQILTETFAGCGWHASPNDLKRIADFQFCGGINRLCHHLIPYSEHGRRKKDWPPHFSDINPWIEYEFVDFNKYLTRLGYLISESQERVNVAVIHPIRDAYLTFKRDNESCLDDLNDKLLENCRNLSYNGISYHFLDETLLETDGFVKDNRIGCSNRDYEYLILPGMSVLGKTTEKLIKRFINNGGKLLILGEKPRYLEGEEFDFSYLNSTCSIDEIYEAQPFKIKYRNVKIHTSYRELENSPFIFVMNPTKERVKQKYNLGDNIKSFISLDLITLKEKKLPLTVQLNAGESKILFPCDEEVISEKQKDIFTFDIQNAKIDFDQNYLVVDFVEYSTDGTNYSEKYPTAGLFDKLLTDRYEGYIYIKYSFDIEKIPSFLRIAVEKTDSANYFFNGKNVELTETTDKEPNIRIVDVTNLVKLGANELVMKAYWYQDEKVYYALYGENVTESLRNCLVYNRELEPIYISGDFGVYTKTGYKPGLEEPYVYAENFYIGEKPQTVTEPVCDGFPFFAGKMTIKQNIILDNPDTLLHFTGTWNIAYVKINGRYAGKMVFKDILDISQFAKKGINEVEIELIIGNRNLLGPHHKGFNENGSVGTFSYELTGTWINGKSEKFADRYNLMKVKSK